MTEYLFYFSLYIIGGACGWVVCAISYKHQLSLLGRELETLGAMLKTFQKKFDDPPILFHKLKDDKGLEEFEEKYYFKK